MIKMDGKGEGHAQRKKQKCKRLLHCKEMVGQLDLQLSRSQNENGDEGSWCRRSLKSMMRKGKVPTNFKEMKHSRSVESDRNGKHNLMEVGNISKFGK